MSDGLEFLIMTALGGVLSILYYIPRFIYKKCGTFVSAISDIIYMTISVFSIVFVLEKACDGNVRLFQIAGLMLGFIIFKIPLLLFSKK